LVLLLFTAILNNGYSSEEDVIYGFFDNISNELQRTRELFITYYNGIYNDEELKIIEDDINIHLSNISLNIRNNKKLIENKN
jgi:flagellin-like hook-associated protein FlgL